MVTLSSIAITPASPSIALGTTQQLTATGTYSDKTTKDISSQVTWASATMTVATVSTAGLATSVKAGTSVISASLSGVTGNDTLTVTAATLVSIAITPTKPTIAPSKTQQFTAIGTYTDKTTANLTTQVKWSSSVPTVATIGLGTGLATAGMTSGTTMIGGTFAGGPTITSVPLAVNATVYAYASNFGDGTVSQYAIGAGGVLTALSPTTVNTMSTTSKPFAVSLEPTGQFVYVANYGANNASQYSIGTGGKLTPIGGGTVTTGTHPNGVTIDPSNTHAYVANYGDNTVSQFDIDPVTGGLTPIKNTVPVATGSFPATIVISPDGKYAYVANYACTGPGCVATQGSISQYTVSSTDGSLTPISPATVNSGSAMSKPNSLAVDPTSSYLYVANQGDNSVTEFVIGAGGALSPVVATPMIASGLAPFSVTVSGIYVYVANSGDNTVSQYSIGTGGSLALIGAAVGAGAGVSSVTVDPTGNYAYATNRGTNTISQYTVTPGTGALVLNGTATSGLNPTSIATGY
jgi:6-phosphogluconolactonase (cycloisomerase 2 family)